MNEALKEAEKAAWQGEVPVGAVVTLNDVVIGRGYNQTEMLHDVSAHAEIIAIREAERELDNWRLEMCSIYVTLEPCPMCAGAILLSRLEKIVIGTQNPRMGFCGSLYNIVEDKRLGHIPEVITGIMEDECRSYLKKFFKKKR
jgi:tRNA(adenine34) deaminase